MALELLNKPLHCTSCCRLEFLPAADYLAIRGIKTKRAEIVGSQLGGAPEKKGRLVTLAIQTTRPGLEEMCFEQVRIEGERPVQLGSRVAALQPLDNPFGPGLSPMS